MVAVPSFVGSQVHAGDLEMPICLQAEQAVIGGICLFPRQAYVLLQEAVSTGLRPDHFVHGTMAQMFAALLSLAERDLPIDSIALAEELAGRWPDELSVYAWVSDCTTLAIAETTHIRYLSELIISKARLRELAKIGEDLTHSACAPRAEPESVATRALELLCSIMELS